MSGKCGITVFITPTATSIRAAPRIRFNPNLVRQRKRLDAFPVRHGAEGGRRRQQVVQMGGAGAGQPGDHHRRPQFDVVDLGVPAQQVGQQQPVLEQLQQLPVEVDHPGAVQAVDLAQCGEVDVEPFAVVVGPEIVQAGVGAGLGVQRVGVQRAVGGHRAIMSRICWASALNWGSARSSRRSGVRSRRLMLL